MKNKKLNICFITEDFYPNFIGGQGIYGLKLVSELSKIGHRITVLAENRGDRKNFWKRKKNVSIFIIPFCFGNQIALALFQYVLFKLKLNNKYFDVLHVNQLSGLFFVIFRPKNVKRIIVSAHNTYYEMSKESGSLFKKIFYKPLIFLERIVYQKADGILCNGNLEKEILENNLKIKNLIKVVPLGVDIPRFNNIDKEKARKLIRKELNLSLDSKIVLYVGRLVKRKNVDLIIKSIVSLNNSKIVGVIIGQGKEKNNLEKISSENIHILGFVKETSQYLLAADVFITVSVAEGGFSLAILEAAAYNLPLIVSKSSFGQYIVKEEVNGYVLDSLNINEIADSIFSILKVKNKTTDKNLVMARKFTWERCALETVNFYNLTY